MILNCIFPRVSDSDWEDSIPDPVDAREIFDLIRNINDPEHPLSLEQLDVVKIDDVDVNDNGNRVKGWKNSKKKFTKLLLPKQKRRLLLGIFFQKVFETNLNFTYQ